MPNLELDLLKALVAVAERGGFTAASDSLARSQSTVSMQIRRLEEIVGVPLFLRNSHSVRLTPQGELLLGYARRLLALADEAVAAVNGKVQPTVLRVGCVEDWAIRALPAAIRALGEVDAHVRVEVVTGTSAALLARLGIEFDLVIAMHPVGAGRGRLLARQQLVWAAPPGRADLANERPLPLALHPDGCLYRKWATHALDQAGVLWRTVFVSPGVGAVEAAVRDGLALSVFAGEMLAPELLAAPEGCGLPSLPEIEVSAHIAATAPATASLLCNSLADARVC